MRRGSSLLPSHEDKTPHPGDFVPGATRPHRSASFRVRGVAIIGLPGTQPYSVVYVASGEQVYEIGLWTQTPHLDARAHALLGSLGFTPPHPLRAVARPAVRARVAVLGADGREGGPEQSRVGRAAGGGHGGRRGGLDHRGAAHARCGARGGRDRVSSHRAHSPQEQGPPRCGLTSGSAEFSRAFGGPDGDLVPSRPWRICILELRRTVCSSYPPGDLDAPQPAARPRRQQAGVHRNGSGPAPTLVSGFVPCDDAPSGTYEGQIRSSRSDVGLYRPPLRARIMPRRRLRPPGQQLALGLAGSTDDKPDDDIEPWPQPRRLGWAKLLARVFAVAVTICRKCGGRMRVLEVVETDDDIARVLHGATAPPRPHPPGQALLFPGGPGAGDRSCCSRAPRVPASRSNPHVPRIVLAPSCLSRRTIVEQHLSALDDRSRPRPPSRFITRPSSVDRGSLGT